MATGKRYSVQYTYRAPGMVADAPWAERFTFDELAMAQTVCRGMVATGAWMRLVDTVTGAVLEGVTR